MVRNLAGSASDAPAAADQGSGQAPVRGAGPEGRLAQQGLAQCVRKTQGTEVWDGLVVGWVGLS